MAEPETSMSSGESYIAELDPCHVHWAHHDKSLTYAECPRTSCVAYVSAKADGSLYRRKHRGAT